MLIAIPRVVPTAAVVGLLLAWVPCGVASAAKPRDFGTGSPGRPPHTATPATAQTSINSSPVCTAPFEQSTPRIIAAGSGDDIVEWTDDSRDTIVWRFPRYENEIKMGARLVVRESQAAVFVNQTSGGGP